MTDTLCDQIFDDLPLYITADLSPVESATLEAHVAECHACAERLAAQRRTIGLLAQLPAEKVTAGIPPGFFEMRIAPRLRSSRGRWSVGVQAAALFLVFFAGMMVRGEMSSESVRPAPPTVRADAIKFVELFDAEAGRGNDLSRGFVALKRLRKE